MFLTLMARPNGPVNPRSGQIPTRAAVGQQPVYATGYDNGALLKRKKKCTTLRFGLPP